jgi:hypothetical protein
MSRQVAICQPHYLPWIGYFEMIDRVDLFVLFDDVHFIKREWKNRNRIRKERRGSDTRWLSVPIERACQRGTPICEARLAPEPDWRTAHLSALHQVYGAAPFFDDLYPWLQGLLAEPHATLGSLNCRLIGALCERLGIMTPRIQSSTLSATGAKTERLVSVLGAVEATDYLANNGSAAYLEPECFEEARISWAFQDYTHPHYAQRSGTTPLPFLSHLSVLDLMMNHGPHSLEILRQGRPEAD